MKVLVSGLITIETTASIDAFPIPYSPVEYRFNGVSTSVSGVGYNLIKAFTTLGTEVLPLSIIGKDMYQNIIIQKLKDISTETTFVLPTLNEICQSVILFDSEKRKILLDLKDIQEKEYPRPEKVLEYADSKQIDLAVCCNINFSRVLLKPLKEKGIPIATDLHAISDINDEYNADFMAYSDILFLSNANIQGREEVFLNGLINKYQHQIIVIGMGEAGSMLYVRTDNAIKRIPAVHTRPVVNTIGAGDALFASFLHFHLKSADPYSSIEKAALFASWKIGENGGAKGFLSENELLAIPYSIR
ncbi:MAG: carbohydrate kinase family protein [Spirochaetaceae bacterium]|jgi:ribokinase|nr:carbohydrate kinase family protein [Spirochaetaceae bacterium]